MRTYRLGLLSVALTAAGWAQPDMKMTEDAAVRQTIDRYIGAMRRGDLEALLPLLKSNAARFSTGGTRVGSPAGNPRAPRPDITKVSYFVRHVELLGSDAAFAVGLWRNAAASSPYESGAITFTLVKEGGVWRIATVQQTVAPALPAVDASAANQPVTRVGEWELLFDGKSAAHWLTMSGARDLGGEWRVADGCLNTIPGGAGADLRSDREYTSFEMQWEWMADTNSNSGVKYRLYGGDMINPGPPRYAAGWEYQIADDAGDPGAKVDDRQKSGALYGVVPVSKAAAKPAGQWNESRLVVAADHVEHWLNGVMTARYTVDVAFASPVSLQHHQSEVRFRNIRIREIAGK